MSPAANPPVAHPGTVLPERLALVLGGGGLKGFAHIGLLRAFEERGIRPSLVAGSSIGALIAAAYATGMPVDDMERRRARAHEKATCSASTGFTWSPSGCSRRHFYLAGPLDALVRDIVPPVTIRSVKTPLLVSTVDLERGAQVIWGLPGLMDVSVVSDAVYASWCAPRVLSAAGDRRSHVRRCQAA